MKKPGYPIRAVSRLTGLSADTLRAWERRYQAVEPRRNARGRIYSEADVQRLKLLREAVDRGHAIGQLASLSDEQLKELMSRSAVLAAQTESSTSGQATALQPDIQSVLSAIDRFDYVEADRELSRLATLLSPEELIEQAVFPLMREVGDRWYRGSFKVAQEHMISSALRNLLGAMVRLYSRTNPSSTILFATPSGERHEFGILAAAMLAAGGGLGTVYLGPDLPAEEIVGAADRTSARVVVIGLTGAAASKAIIKELQYLSEKLPEKTELWVGGAMPEELMREIKATRAIFIEDFSALESHLSRLGAQF